MNEAPFTLLREMSATVHDFLRLVPAAARAAMGDVPVATTKSGATIGDGAKQVEITLTEIPEKRIGSFRLSRIEAHFTFHGYSEVERMTFLERFDRVTQRGGG
jgi:hypothetical protein|tara:strand:+ start:26 stop:334 length:309 start_codon:yes stop_codon:yes gene_type:complete